MKQIVATVMQTVLEPFRGLSDEKLAVIAELLEKESKYFSEFAARVLPQENTTLMAIVGAILAGIGVISFVALRKKN